jgi:hypothetical protein
MKNRKGSIDNENGNGHGIPGVEVHGLSIA